MDLRLRRDPRQQQRAALGGNSDLRFVPTCLEDGTYAPVQCHAETGFCWCVTQAGKPLPNTSVKFALPNCARRGKSSPRRRSSPRGHRQKKGKGKSKKCERINKAQFNTNLIKMFKTEYNRKSPPPSTEDMQVDLERAVLNWKFSSLDLDGDDYLNSVEYKDLSRMVRKAVKPKKCSKVFTKLCDKDEDQRISRDEWAFCLGLDFNHRYVRAGERVDVTSTVSSTPMATLRKRPVKWMTNNVKIIWFIRSCQLSAVSKHQRNHGATVVAPDKDGRDLRLIQIQDHPCGSAMCGGGLMGGKAGIEPTRGVKTWKSLLRQEA
uniref:Thyroglobulin type-1 domain-containing protein n=1 Tax=Timema shepardi TaxID=629360 RepID=A0A7R9B161_TIMSH|nr:unnamed protein product [Timema shepardi]